MKLSKDDHRRFEGSGLQVRHPGASRLFESMRGRRLLVVGDLMLDRYIHGDVERVSPEAPVPVLRVDEMEDRPGGAANVAANAASLGAQVQVVGCVGADTEGEALRDLMRERGVGVEGLVVTASRVTTVKSRLVSRAQQLARFDRENDQPIEGRESVRLQDCLEQALSTADGVAIADYDKGVLTPPLLSRVLERAGARRIPVVVDPKRRNFFRYAGATVFKPNVRELSDAFGGEVLPFRRAWIEEARRRLGVQYLLLTMGEEGMLMVGPDADPVQLPATARAVYDVSGAGDTATAVLALSLATGAPPQEAALLANVAAGIQVERPGVSTVTPAEILALLPP